MSGLSSIVVAGAIALGGVGDQHVQNALRLVRDAHAIRDCVEVKASVVVPLPAFEAEVLDVLRAMPEANVQWNDGCQCETQRLVRTTYWVSADGDLRKETRNVTAIGDSDRTTSVDGLTESGTWSLASRTASVAQIRSWNAVPGAELRSRIHRGEYLTGVRACLDLLSNAGDTRIIEESRPGILTLSSEAARVSCDVDASSGEVMTIRAQRVPGAFVEYRFGPRSDTPLLPARYPKFKTWSNEPPIEGESAFILEEYESARAIDPASAGPFHWEQWVDHAHDVVNERVVRADGSTDESLTKQLHRDAQLRSTQPPDLFIEASDGSLKPRPRGGQLRGWLLAGGVTCLALGVAVWYRRRMP